MSAFGISRATCIITNFCIHAYRTLHVFLKKLLKTICYLSGCPHYNAMSVRKDKILVSSDFNIVGGFNALVKIFSKMNFLSNNICKSYGWLTVSIIMKCHYLFSNMVVSCDADIKWIDKHQNSKYPLNKVIKFSAVMVDHWWATAKSTICWVKSPPPPTCTCWIGFT